MRILLDKLNMTLSTKTRLDGLWVGSCCDDDGELLRKACKAMVLIKEHDPLRYERIRKDVRRIWVAMLPGAWGRYQAETESCQVDSRFVKTCDPIFIASIIVHEATHARLRRFGYAEPLRHRLEKACHKQQVAFATKHPGGEVVRDWLRGTFPLADNYTNEAYAERDVDGHLTAARDLGIPPWIVTTALRIRGFLRRLAKIKRRMSRGSQPG